jgi:hypothetical protein
MLAGLLGSGANIAALMGGGSASGTSAARLSFVGTGFRWPTVGQATTNVFMVTERYFGTPDYSMTDPRPFAPSFFNPTTGETNLAAGTSITIQGWAIEYPSGTWTVCDNAADGGMVTIDNTTAAGGALLPRVPITLPANTMIRMRLAFFVSASGITIPRNSNDDQNALGGGSKNQGGATTLFSRLSSTGAALTNIGGVNYHPAYMVAKGGDGRPAFLVLGDSIGYGVNATQTGAAYTSRNAFGYVEVGLDSNSGGKRLALFNASVPGQRAAGGSGWDVAANWQLKINALTAAYTAGGNVWPFDYIISQHITNSVPYTNDSAVLRTGFARYYNLLKSTFNKPITQIEGLPGVTSSDGFQTVGNQTAASGKGYPTASAGDMWTFNADVGTDGVPDAADYYRANGFIEDSIGAWRYVSADLTTNRHRWAVRSFTTTLAASAAQNATSVSMTAAPTVGMTLYIAQAGGGFSAVGRNVKSVTGSGPYTVGFDATPISDAAGANNGAVVQESASEGLHPSAIVHRDVLSVAITDWKTRRGWV